MADNITPGTTFATANMKPAAAGGENIDAVWGRNIGDFLAALRGAPVPFVGASVTGGTTGIDPTTKTFTNLVYVLGVNGHNTLCGTYASYGTYTSGGSPDCYGTHGFVFYGDLGTYTATTTLATYNIGGVFTFGTTAKFDFPIGSYLSPRAWGTFSAYFSGTAADHSSSITVTGTIGDILLYSTWA